MILWGHMPVLDPPLTFYNSIKSYILIWKQLFYKLLIYHILSSSLEQQSMTIIHIWNKETYTNPWLIITMCTKNVLSICCVDTVCPRLLNWFSFTFISCLQHHHIYQTERNISGSLTFKCQVLNSTYWTFIEEHTCNISCIHMTVYMYGGANVQ